MARKRLEGERYFFRLSKEQKRRLDHMAVDAGENSTEAFGGKMLGDLIDRLWESYDPKTINPPTKPARPRAPKG